MTKLDIAIGHSIMLFSSFRDNSHLTIPDVTCQYVAFAIERSWSSLPSCLARNSVPVNDDRLERFGLELLHFFFCFASRESFH